MEAKQFRLRIKQQSRSEQRGNISVGEGESIWSKYEQLWILTFKCLLSKIVSVILLHSLVQEKYWSGVHQNFKQITTCPTHTNFYSTCVRTQPAGWAEWQWKGTLLLLLRSARLQGREAENRSNCSRLSLEIKWIYCLCSEAVNAVWISQAHRCSSRWEISDERPAQLTQDQLPDEFSLQPATLSTQSC